MKKAARDGSFAKLFGKGAKQILVVAQSNDDGNPCIEVTVALGEGGTAMCRSSFKEGDDAKRDEAFASIDEAKAEKMAQPLRDALK